jgi:hypothetical protein
MLQASHPHRNSDNDSLALTTRFIKFTQTEIKEVSVNEKKEDLKRSCLSRVMHCVIHQ